MERNKNERKNFIQAGKKIAKIRICKVRDTGETPQETKTKNNKLY